MRRLALFIAIASLAAAQSTATISLSNGVQLQIATDLGTPTGQQSINIEMTRASGNSFYRVFRDQNKLAVFAYELVLRLAASGDRLTATAKPTETEFAARFPAADGGKPVPTLSSEQQIGTISSGQRANIGLFHLEGVGLSVTDTLHLKMDDNPPPQSGRIRFSGLKTSDKKPLIAGSSSVSGKYAMFYLPGRGGYFFSIEAVPGKPFVPAGTIDRNHMTFTVDNSNFEIFADSPILSDPPTGELWVYHDPNYKPEGNWTQDLRNGKGADGSFMAAADSLAWWFSSEPRP